MNSRDIGSVTHWLMIPFMIFFAGCNIDTQPGEAIQIEDGNRFSLNGPLIAHYGFDEASGVTAYDASTNKLDGTIYGAGRVLGQVGNALLFDASVERVGVHHYIQNIFFPGIITIDAWINPSTAGTGIIQHVVGGALEEGFQFRINNGKLELAIFSGGSAIPVVTSLTSISPSVWTHVAATMDGSTARVYINGVEDSSNIVTYPIGDILNSMNIGAFGWNGSTQLFSGTIDEVRLFDIALTQTDITNYYNATK